MGLTPGTYYTFSVTAENAVSSQDTINDRTATITVTTLEGGISKLRQTCLLPVVKVCYIETLISHVEMPLIYQFSLGVPPFHLSPGDLLAYKLVLVYNYTSK